MSKTNTSMPGMPMPFMHMGCPTEIITMRATGNESVCLSPITEGVQHIVGLSPAMGDFLDLDAILNQTTAHVSLSDVGSFVTSALTSTGTTLYFDPTGTGHGTIPFAVLDGLNTTVAQLVANGGLQYSASQVSVTPAYNTPYNLRPDGQVTVMMRAPVNGIATQVLNGFDPLHSDVLDLSSVLAKTAALQDLSNVASFVTASASGGNTTLSVTSAGVTHAFAVLTGVTTTVAQLVADHAFAYSGIVTSHGGNSGANPVNFRSAGQEIISVQPITHGVQQYNNFNMGHGDVLDVNLVVRNSAMRADMSNAAQFITATSSAAGTTLSFDTTGTGHAGTPFALLAGVNTTVAQLVAAGGLKYDIAHLTVQPTYATPLTLRLDGNETVRLLPIVPGMSAEVLNQFNPLAGDVLDLSTILNRTTAAPDLSNVGSYISATVANGNTTLTLTQGHEGAPGGAFATLTGVTTSVAQLMADHALQFIATPTASYASPGETFVFRPEGQEAAILYDAHATGVNIPTQMQNFSVAGGDGLVIGNFMTQAHLSGVTLGNISDFLSTTHVGANTDLWFDPTGSSHAGAGTLEAVFQNSSFSVSDLLAHSAIHLSEQT